jgi:hypothetical protein
MVHDWGIGQNSSLLPDIQNSQTTRTEQGTDHSEEENKLRM